MNIKQLEYFVAVAETLNFTTAAGKCFISQAAITQQIKALENTLDIKLFDRTNKKVELTAAGRSYLYDVKQILEQLDAAHLRAREASKGITGTIVIGIVRGYEYEDISDKLRAFHNTYPNVRMEFIRENQSILYDSLATGQCDIILNLAPFKRSYPQFEHMHLKTYPMYALLYPGHPLAKKRTLKYQDLKGNDFVILEPEERATDEAEEVLLCYERGGFIPNITYREKELQTMLFMISIGLGIGILPEYCVKYYMTESNIIVVPLLDRNNQNEVMEFEAAWNREHVNPVVEKIIKYLK